MRKITFLVVALCATMFANAAITLPLSEKILPCVTKVRLQLR